MTKNKQILLGIALLSLTQSSLAAIYKWEDENHEIHYSENPPPNVNATIINPQDAPSSSAAQEKARAEKLEAQFSEEKKKQLEEQAKEKIASDNAKIKASNCAEAKAHLADLQSKTRIRIIDNTGNVVMLSEDQQNQEINRTQEAIRVNCSP